MQYTKKDIKEYKELYGNSSEYYCNPCSLYAKVKCFKIGNLPDKLRNIKKYEAEFDTDTLENQVKFEKDYLSVTL